jgi:hypothetical protein
MEFDLTKETLIKFGKAPKAVPGRPHISTLHRWRLRGVRGVKLETCLVGGRRFTSIEAIDRFIAATTAAANGEAPPTRTPSQRKRAIERAERELGIGDIADDLIATKNHEEISQKLE